MKNNLDIKSMRKLLLFLWFIVLCNYAYSSVRRYATYFDESSYMMYSCNYIIKGEIIDKMIVGYTRDDYNVVAIKVSIKDKYGSNIEDTIWIYPDIELYFNKQKRFDEIDRDSVYYISGEDINYETSFSINYDINGNFKIGQLCFIRLRKEKDTYIYCLSDVYLPLYVRDNNVYVKVNRFQKYTNVFRLSKNHNKLSVRRFERLIKKKTGTR